MPYNWPASELTVSGKIGIGTDTPDEQLEVQGNIKLNEGVAIGSFSNDATFASAGDQSVPTTLAVRNYINIQVAELNTALTTKAERGGASDQDFQTNNLSVQGNLNIIGTTTLQLANGSVNTEQLANGSVTLDKLNRSVSSAFLSSSGGVITGGDLTLKATANDPGDIVFQDSTNRQKGRIWSNTATNVAGLYLSSRDNTPDISIEQGGNVGIGTSSPNDRLDVAGNLRILTDSNPIRFTSGWTAFPDATTNQAEICNDTGTYKTLMIVGNKSAGLGRRVSIWDRLDVNGELFVGSNPIKFTSGWTAFPDSANNKAEICNDIGTYKTLMIVGNKSAGLGRRVSIWDRLDVNGNLFVTGRLHVTDVPHGDRQNVQWDSGSKLFYQDSSSKRTKENITALDDDFSKILNAEPKTYTRPGDSERWEIGYVAEEFHELGLEKLVYYGQDKLPQAINYPKIIMYLLEVVKSHEKKLKTYEQNHEPERTES